MRQAYCRQGPPCSLDQGVSVQTSTIHCEPLWTRLLDRIEAAQAALPARPDTALQELSAAHVILLAKLNAETRPVSADFATLRLTARERQVLVLLAEGNRNKEIAIALRLRERTVKFHVANLLQKLGAQSRTEALRNAYDLGLLETGRTTSE